MSHDSNANDASYAMRTMNAVMAFGHSTNTPAWPCAPDPRQPVLHSLTSPSERPRHDGCSAVRCSGVVLQLCHLSCHLLLHLLLVLYHSILLHCHLFLDLPLLVLDGHLHGLLLEGGLLLGSLLVQAQLLLAGKLLERRLLHLHLLFNLLEVLRLLLL